MDLLDLIRNQINALPAGDHLHGLRSVLHHIETAYKHFARGQIEADESAFTDTIYRANQAFEGSVKEAYRVLADKDPSRIRPYDIEQYLEEQKIFKDRILGQFTNYREEWRNPSTHDYNLNFDESEAFLAIVSVSAFAKLLVDEIAERLSYVAIQKDVASQGSPKTVDLTTAASLIIRVTTALHSFPRFYKERHSSTPIESEAQLMGALSGFLSSILPDVQTTTGRIFRGAKPHYIDMVISSGSEKIIIELKRGQNRALTDRGIEQLRTYLDVTGAKYGVLFMYTQSIEYDVTVLVDPSNHSEIHLIRPLTEG